MSRNPHFRNEREGRVAQMSRQEEIIARKRQEILEKQKTSELAKQVAAAQSSAVPPTIPDNKPTTTVPKQPIEPELPHSKNTFTNDGSFFENFMKITEAAKKADEEKQRLEAERLAKEEEIKEKLAEEQRLKEEAANIPPVNDGPFFNMSFPPNPVPMHAAPMFHQTIPLLNLGAPPPPPPMPVAVAAPIEPEIEFTPQPPPPTFEGNQFTNENFEQINREIIDQPPPLHQQPIFNLPHHQLQNSNSDSLQCIPTTIDGLIEYIAINGDDFEGKIVSQIEQMNERTLFRFLNDKNSENYKIFKEKVLGYRLKHPKKCSQVPGNNDEKYDPEDVLRDDAEELERRKDYSDDSDSEYMQEAKERNLENIKRIIDSGTAKKRFASEIDDEYSTDDGDRTDEDDHMEMYRRIQMRENTLDDEEDSKEQNTADTSGLDSSKRNRKKRSRWGEKIEQKPTTVAHSSKGPPIMLTTVTRTDPALLNYARQNYGTINLSEDDWKHCEEHFKVNLLYQDMLRKRDEIDRLAKSGRFKYEYDSDEDTTNGTWEHKMRMAEMEATTAWATALNRQSEGKHHIGDFLPPEELKKFMEIYKSKQTNREPDLSDYKEYKLKEDNKGFQMLQKLGWTEGQGLGADGGGIVNPVNKAVQRDSNQGLGSTSNTIPEAGDNEYEAYRKRMMLAYRFRPNPLNNPRRAYY